jgi:hypothetical protein
VSPRVLPLWAGPLEVGWRAGIGAALIVGGYLALLLIPLVLASDFEPQLKAALQGAHAVDVSVSCARPFRANVLMKSVSRATKTSSIFRLNGGCANCSRLRTNTLH